MAGVAAALAASPAMAREHAPAAHRDLTGLWSNASLTELERPDDFKTLTVTDDQARAFEKRRRGKPPEVPPEDNPVGGLESEWWETDVGLARIRGQVRTSWIVSPADGKRPVTAEAKAAGKLRREASLRAPDNPESRDFSERCMEAGAAAPIQNGGLNDNYQFVVAGDRLAIYAEWMHDLRIVRIGDTRHPPPNVRVVGGDSIGHWEGDTLVVETTNFRPEEIRDPAGDPNADMKVVERLTRTSPTEITYSYRVSQPRRFSQTWAAEMVFHPAKGAIYEYACHEGNYALPDMLAGARAMDQRPGPQPAASR